MDTNIKAKQNNENTLKNVSIKDFINKYLIDRIGKIKEDNPYFAFLLMAVGIEFLGRYLDGCSWEQKGVSETAFNGAILELFPEGKYDKFDLFHNLRCGLAHSLLMQGNLTLSDKKSEGSISCDEFYDDFVKACNKILTMPPSDRKSLDEKFFTVTTTENGASTTGNTEEIKHVKKTN